MHTAGFSPSSLGLVVGLAPCDEIGAGRDDADFLTQLLSDPEVAKHFKKGELESICTTDFHYKHIESRFKKLGL